MSRRTGLALAVVAAVAAYISWRSSSEWDYPLEAGPPIDALTHGRIHEFLAARPAMGPIAMLIRVPFAAVARLIWTDDATGNSHLPFLYEYRFGVFPCVFAAGALGVVLAGIMRRLGRPALLGALVVALAVVNPIALRAIHFGHPEEIVCAAMTVGAAVAGLRGRPWLAAVLIALAVATKQWALVAVPAVALTVAPERLKRPAQALVAISVLLLVPLLAVDAGSLVDSTKKLADLRGTFVFPASIWWPFAPAVHDLPAGLFVVPGLRAMPGWLGLVARPLILAMGVAAALLFRRRVRSDPLERALPLLALVLLLRCVLDPADNGYYHLPFFMALLAADGLTGRFAASIVAAAWFQFLLHVSTSAATLNALYLAWAVPFALYLAGRASGVDWAALFRTRVVRGRAAEPSPRP